MADSYVRRTVITRLSVDEDHREFLEETITEWRRGCQISTDMAWNRCHAKGDVQRLAYDAVREKTNLCSQHAILATHQAAEAISGCVQRRETGRKASKPRFSSPSVKYDTRTMTLFEDDTVSLSTTRDRIRCSLVLPEDDCGYQHQYLDSEEWNVTESILTVRDGDFFLHIGFRRYKNEIERETAEDGTVLGVDLGVKNIAVTSTAEFFSGEELLHRINEFEKVRGGLQRTATRSAHRTLVGLRGRVHRYIRDIMHCVSTSLVQEAVRYNCDIIAFEDLSHIRDRTHAPWGHIWAFRKIIQFVGYKAETLGIAVKQVDAAETSTQCSECSFTAEENRPSRGIFRCRRCGTELNADYNAAKNIGLRYVRRGQQLSRRTGNSQLALKSGTVTPKGGFTAYPDGYKEEFTDKSLFESGRIA